MLRLLTDENLNQRILRGLRRRLPKMDCLVVQHAGMAGFSDEWLLELAAIEGRVIVTHDVSMTESSFSCAMTACASAKQARRSSGF